MMRRNKGQLEFIIENESKNEPEQLVMNFINPDYSSQVWRIYEPFYTETKYQEHIKNELAKGISKENLPDRYEFLSRHYINSPAEKAFYNTYVYNIFTGWGKVPPEGLASPEYNRAASIEDEKPLTD